MKISGIICEYNPQHNGHLYHLEQVRRGLEGAGQDSAGYGLFNVNKRIKLYYNQPDGLHIESDPAGGSVVSFRVPVRRTGHV